MVTCAVTNEHLTCNLVMIGTSSRSKCANIKAIIEKQEDIIENILLALVVTLSRYYWELGEKLYLRVRKAGKKSFNKFSNTTESDENVKL